MNKHNSPSILKIILLIVTVLSAGCGPVTTIPSPTSTAVPTPTETKIPLPTSTPDLIHPQGIIIYSDSHRVYSVNLQAQRTKVVYETNDSLGSVTILDKKIYIAVRTQIEVDPYLSKIIRLNLDGTGIEQLASSTDRYSNFYLQSISPNKEYVVFYGTRTILIIDTKTKSIQSISEEGSHRLFLMAWSSDSKKIFFLDAAYTSRGWDQSRLLEYSVETNELDVMLPEFPDPNYILDPEDPTSTVVWAPDKSDVLLNLSSNFTYSTKNSIQPKLYIYSPMNQDMEQIELPGKASTVIWLKNGTGILLNIWNKDQPDIFLLDTKSQKLEKIKENEYIYHSSWSPDHQKLVILTKKDEQTYLYLFDDTDFKLELLTNIGHLQSPFNISWHPSNDMILYEQSEFSLSENRYLYFLDINEQTPKKLHSLKGIEVKTKITEHWWWYHPAWSPDGNFFAYVTMSSTAKDYAQNFILNIQSIETEGNMQIQIPRENFIGSLFWMD